MHQRFGANAPRPRWGRGRNGRNVDSCDYVCSKFAMVQFLGNDDRREGATATGDDSGSMEMARPAVVTADGRFCSENTLGATDSFVRTSQKGIMDVLEGFE